MVQYRVVLSGRAVSAVLSVGCVIGFNYSMIWNRHGDNNVRAYVDLGARRLMGCKSMSLNEMPSPVRARLAGNYAPEELL